jgi:hypothetical protein
MKRIDFSTEVYRDAVVWFGEFLTPIAQLEHLQVRVHRR